MIPSTKYQVPSTKYQVPSTKFLSSLAFLSFLPLLFSPPTFAASSSLGASALEEISIGLSNYDELAAECLDILAYENSIPDLCAEFIDESLEIAINSSYRFEENRPAVRGSSNSQTIAAQINYDAKQAYLDNIESKARSRASRNAQGLFAYNPDQLGYVELSSGHGLSASVKGVKVIADNKLNVSEKKEGHAALIAIALGAAASIAIAISLNSSGTDKTSTNHPCQDPDTTCND